MTSLHSRVTLTVGLLVGLVVPAAAPVLALVTVTLTVIECERLPLVPVTVTV